MLKYIVQALIILKSKELFDDIWMIQQS